MYVPDKVLGFGRLLSIIFKASAKKCTMSFFYHVSDIDYLSLSVSKQTSNDSMVPPTIKWVMPGNMLFGIEFFTRKKNFY